MAFLGYSLFLILLFAVQTTWLGLFSVAGVTPDLALIFALYCGIYFQGNTGVALAGATGFLQDCLSGGLLGVNMLSKSLIGLFISNLKDQLLLENIPTVCLLLALAAFFDGLVYYAVSAILLKGGMPEGFFLTSLPVFAVYNAVAGPLLFLVLNRIKKRFQRKNPTFSL
ncbi:MAG: rod shape-determining protein MreD [Nitrospinales bacterium]